MAKKTIIVDDLDGTENASTIHFSVDRDEYEIDLAKHNADKLREALAPFTKKATRVSGPKRPSRNGQTRSVREWAIANGLKVPARGKIPNAVQEAYDKAH